MADSENDDDIYNVVQPDLSLICDKKMLDDQGCNGAPNVIIEILLPSSIKLDRWKKYQLYEKAGVQEYWIVDPVNQSVEAHLLIESQYILHGVFTKEDTISVNLLTGLTIDLNHIFE